MNNENNFPTDIFPPIIEDYVNELNSKHGLTKDYLYSSFLAVMSVLLGNRFETSPFGFKLKPVLWIAIVGNSGIKKTPAISSMTRPLHELNRLFIDEYKKEYAKYKEAKESSDEGGKVDKPIPKQILVDDATMEALYQIMLNNPEGSLMIRDELMGLINDASRYSKSGQEERLLSIYSGVSIQINRKGDDKYDQIDNPFLSLLGGIQPKVMIKFFSNGREFNGFVERVLFCYPKEPTIQPPARGFDDAFYDEYEKLVLGFKKKSSELYKTTDGVVNIKFNSDAFNALDDWLKKNVYAETDEVLLAYKMKIEATTIKFALIIELISSLSKGVKSEFISLESTNSAFKLSEYYIKCYEDVLSVVSNGLPSKEQKELEIQSLAITHLLKDKPKKDKTRENLVKEMYKSGCRQSEIAKATGISKSVVSFFLKK